MRSGRLTLETAAVVMKEGVSAAVREGRTEYWKGRECESTCKSPVSLYMAAPVILQLTPPYPWCLLYLHSPQGCYTCSSHLQLSASQVLLMSSWTPHPLNK